MRNKDTYEAHDVVRHYATQKYLQKPEETILNIFRDKLKPMKMLDIGVGAGRTTPYFASHVAEYVGIDCSANMIKACEQQFRDFHKNISFKVCDVRSMKIFDNNYFDFILFSFNGLDYISHEDRLLALQQIRRVCKRGGFFCFSAHNLQSIANLYAIRSKHPAKLLYRIFVRNPLLTVLNGRFDKIKKHGYAIIRDSSHWFRLKTYYIHPGEQVKQLDNLGFNHIRIYSLDGKEVEEVSRFERTSANSWLYYLCRSE